LGVTTGNSNIVLGYNAGCGITTTFQNVAIGVSCLNQVNGNNNTAVGYRIADWLTAGDNNTVVGADACRILTTGSGNIVIGALVEVPTHDKQLSQYRQRNPRRYGCSWVDHRGC
jgi:hypothetical protein